MLEFARSSKLYGYLNVGIVGILFCVNFRFSVQFSPKRL